MSPKAADFFLLRTASLDPSAFDNTRAAFADGESFSNSPILQDPFFREALFLASTNLGRRIDDPAAWSDELFRLSVARYLNRMAFRPTPFGLFAGVSLGLAGDECQLRITDAEGSKRVGRLDQGILSDIHAGLLADPDTNLAILRRASLSINSSAWAAPDGLRFIEAVREDGLLHYRLSKVDLTAPIAHVRAFVGIGEKPFAQIVSSLIAEFCIAVEQAETFVATLAEEQVLIVSPQIAITGENSIPEFVAELERLSPQDPSLRRAAKVQALLDRIGTDPAENLGIYKKAFEEFETAEEPADNTKILQVDLYRPPHIATLPQKLLDGIVAETWNLRGLLTGAPQDDARIFASEFQERYGDANIPLLEMLDADFGIPFGSASHVEAPLLDGMNLGAQRDGSAPRLDEKTFALAQKAWLTHAREIALDDAYLSTLTPQIASLPSFAVFGSLAAESFEALSKGEYEFAIRGLSPLPALALLGRFCLDDPALARKAKHFIATHEADTENVIVAEVAHTPEGRAANVLLRPVLREHEIVYMGKSGAPPDRQIPASDLYVSCLNGQIVLTRGKTGQRIIPRLTNAHAFHVERNVPIYKFLGMLQLQHAPATRDPWGGLAETAKFLPGLKYRHIRICAPRWRLNRDDLREMLKSDVNDVSGILKPLLNAESLRKIRARSGDNFIELDLDHKLDRALLLEEARRNTELTIEEIAPGNGEVVSDTRGRKLRNEIVIPVSCHHPAGGDPAAVPAPAAKMAHHPGDDWLYARIFCGSAAADRLITELFPGFAEDAAAVGCDRAFFIRYWQNGQHLRLRAHGTRDGLRALQNALEQRLHPYLQSREASRFEYATYFPEYYRYGGQLGLPLCEKIFSADSGFVSAGLASLADVSNREDARWRFALAALFHLLRVFDLGHDAEIALITPMIEGYGGEFRLDKNRRGQLNEKYREHRAAVDDLIRGNSGNWADIIEARRQQIAPLVQQLKSVTSMGSLVTIVQSLLHMCANRIFPEQARQHELLLLHFMAKSMASIRGRQRYDKKFAASQEQ